MSLSTHQSDMDSDIDWNDTTSPPTDTETTEQGSGLFMFEDYNQRIIIAFVLCVVLLIGSVGNTLVILAVILSRRLRTPTNCFVINLALADLLTCLNFPFAIVAMLSIDGWPLPDLVCAISSAVTFICLGASIMTLALIAYNRWFLLTKPKSNFQKLYTVRNICLMVGVAWIYPFTLVVVPHLAGLGRLGYSKEYKSCTQDTSLPTSEYFSLIAGAGAILPVFLVVVIIYVNIYLFVLRQSKKMASMSASAISRSTAPKAEVRVAIETSSSNVASNETSLVSIELSSGKDESHTMVNNATSLHDLRGTMPIDPTEREITSRASGERSESRMMTKNGENAILLKESGDSKIDAFQAPDTCPKLKMPKMPKVPKVTSSHRQDERPREAPSGQIASARAPSTLNRHHVVVTKRLSIIVLAFFICLLPFGVSVRRRRAPERPRYSLDRSHLELQQLRQPTHLRANHAGVPGRHGLRHLLSIQEHP